MDELTFDKTALRTNLSLVTLLEVQQLHLEHPLLEHVEVSQACRELVDDSLGLPRLERRLVGAQESPPRLQLSEVDVVERIAGPVERRGGTSMDASCASSVAA